MKRPRIFFNTTFLLAVLYAGTAEAQTPRTVPSSYPSAVPVNYIRTWDAKVPELDPNALMSRPLHDVQQSTQYFDGLGRPLQTVVKQGCYPTDGTAVDMISMREYDALGREPFQYLPTPSTATGTTKNDGSFKPDPFAQQTTFYGGSGSPIAGQGETFFYGETQFEPSPLNRVTEAAAPGNTWAGSMYKSAESDRHSVKAKYYVNAATDSVRIWKVTVAAVGSLSAYTSTGTYAAGELYKFITTDEKHKQVIEFRDKSNKVVLKKIQLTAADDDGSGSGHGGWLCTYYIYDNRNNLRCIVPPGGVELISSNWVLTNTTILAEQCFRYEYDSRGRMILKKVPGADPVYMVYDARDRLVMTQDGKQRTGSPQIWLVNHYDELNRPIQTGSVSTTYSGLNGKTFLQILSAAAAGTTYPFAVANVPGSAYYTKLTQTGYDNYDGLDPAETQFTKDLDNNYTTGSYLHTTYNTAPLYAQQPIQSFQTRGLVTWTKALIYGFNYYVYTVHIYDDKGRLIQLKKKNFSGGAFITTIQYNWAGQPLRIVRRHRKGLSPVQTSITLTDLSYDDLGRVTQTRMKIKNDRINNNQFPAAWTTLSRNEYDALGRLVKKKLGLKKDTTGNYTTEALASLEYSYNIRGWLLGINKDYISGALNNDRYFGMELGYDKNPVLGTYSTPQYNGNIAGTLWKSEGDGQQRKYNFSYDAVNRLTGAAFGQYASGSGSSAVFNTGAGVDFTVSGITYDHNGNLKTLNRSGLLLNSSAPVDGLTYSYGQNSNRLLGVSDSAPDAGMSLGDFRDSANVNTDDYAYNVNGSLTRDLNKDISNISYYSVAELPQQITTSKGKVDYNYDALGNKAWKNVTDNSVPGKTITTYLKYLDDFVYESRVTAPVDPANPDYTDDLLFMLHGEGRIRALYNDPQHPHTLTGLTYDYFIKDHLGNIRMVLTEEQKPDVYPPATMETAQAVTENTYYDNIDLTRFAKSGISGYPVDEATDPNDYVAKTEGDGNNIGPSLLLKVMAGDQFTVQVSSWYKKNGASPATPVDPLTALIAALAGGVSHASPMHGTATALINSGALDPSALGFLNSRDAPAGGKPKAYLNWVLLDEQLKIAKDEGGNIIAGGYSGADPVGSDEEFKTHAFANTPVKKSGYLYIYVSNETPNIDVFFDNLQVNHIRGPILEETHYYPYGMKMAGISSKAYGSLKNLYQYQGEYAEFDEDTGWNDFELRSYDAQTGRFIQQDPYDQFPSPYTGMGNNPVSNIDPSGGYIFNMSAGQFWGMGIGMVGGALAGYYISKSNGGNGMDGALMGAVGGGAAGYGLGSMNWSGVGNALGNAGRWMGNQLGGGWQETSLLLAQSSYNGAGSGDDWVRNPNPQGISVSDLAHQDNNSLFNDLRSTILTYTMGVFQNIGNKMVDHFAANTGTDFFDEILNNQITASSQFQNSFNNALQLIKTRILDINGDFSLYGKPQDFINPSFPKWEGRNPLSPNSLYTLIGGTQYSDITLTRYKYNARTRSFSGRITTTIMDDFGVSASDVKNASKIPFSKGIRSMWYLQHIRGYKPYRTVYTRQFNIKF